MNNYLLSLALFALTFISTTQAVPPSGSPTPQCGVYGNPGVCSACGEDACFANGDPPIPNPGNDGCGCYWTGTFCDDTTCDPTIDPTIDPTSDPTIDPTIDPTSDPTVPTTNPTQAPTSLTKAPTTSSDSSDSSEGSSEDIAAAKALFNNEDEELNGDENDNNNGATTSVISLHFSDETVMNVWILFGVLMVVNIVFCCMCNKRKKGVAKIVDESSTMDNVHI